ncbi:hypothetical protein ACWV26_12605 [Rummeliibacillus sp. JY-2-4R]
MIQLREEKTNIVSSLIDDIESKIQKMTEESFQSIEKQKELAQRRQILAHAYSKVSSGMTQLIISDMVAEIEKELANLEETARYCNYHKEYYTEILLVVKETVKELENENK